MAIVVKRRDPGATFMTVAMALVWTYLLISGAQRIFAATVMLAVELLPFIVALGR